MPVEGRYVGTGGSGRTRKGMVVPICCSKCRRPMKKRKDTKQTFFICHKCLRDRVNT